MTISVLWIFTVKNETSAENPFFFKPLPNSPMLEARPANPTPPAPPAPGPGGHGHTSLTLGSHQDQRDLARVAVVGHPAVVVVDCLETNFILQAEDKDNSVHPHGELGRQEGEGAEGSE